MNFDFTCESRDSLRFIIYNLYTITIYYVYLVGDIKTVPQAVPPPLTSPAQAPLRPRQLSQTEIESE